MVATLRGVEQLYVATLLDVFDPIADVIVAKQGTHPRDQCSADQQKDPLRTDGQLKNGESLHASYRIQTSFRRRIYAVHAV